MTMPDATDSITHYRTEEPPHEPGWYWMEPKDPTTGDHVRTEPVKVFDRGDVLRVSLKTRTEALDSFDALWTGPIPGPEAIAEEAPDLESLPSGDDASDTYQQDVRDLLEACRLETHARPKSAHAVVQEEIIPQIQTAMSDEYTALREAARRAESLLTDLRQRRLPTQNDIWQALGFLRQALSWHTTNMKEENDPPKQDTAFASTPWDPEHPDETGHAHVWASDGDLVATVCDAPVYGEAAYERARLIAAAPEMREACEAIISAVTPEAKASYTEAQRAARKAQDALDAARGVTTGPE